MQLLYQDLMRSEKIETLIGQLSSREIINLSNMNGGLKEVLTGLVFGHVGERILYIAATDYQAQKIARELETILPQKVLYFPMEPIHDYFADVHSHEISHQRLDVFEKLLSDEKYVVVAGAETLLKKLMPRKRFESLVFSLALEDTADPVELMTRFYDLGYEAVSQVEAKGQVAHRGGIIDVFPPTGEQAYRIDFFGDTIESIRHFDPQTQLSTHNLEKAEILPGREIILDEDERSKAFRQIRKNYGDSLEYAALIERLSEDPTAHDETLFAFIKTDATLLDYIGECLVIWDEPPRIKESEGVFQKKLFSDLETLMQDYLMLPEEKNKFYSFSKIEKAVEKQTQLKYHLFTSRGKKGITLDMGVKDNDSFLGQWPLFVAFIQKQLAKNAIIQLRARDEAGLQKIEKLLTEAEIYRFTKDVMPGIQLVIGEINSGFEMPEERLVCVNQSEIIKESGRDKKRRKKKGRKIDSFTQLNQGDFVVHDTHGIGIYRGIEQLKIDETRKDLMVIEYANDARFYCPVDQMDAIQVYVGTGEKKPKINQLGTNDWSKSKSRVKAAVAEMADELITLYAQRQNLKGYAFGPDSNWQREFEESFPHEETNDQLQAVEEIKADMESTRPMDRLLCGDVGYGKTEVALRAIFKAVMEGKQVAFLVPTTILAQQHYQTVMDRFKKYPVSVGVLSRFRTKTEQEKTIKELAAGQIDLVIGTHRLLSKDVKFKDLGLLVVDEEQRFGVGHKERIKQLKENVDVLTLSATPIPRTLHMSMIGVRDMSIIDEPPAGRRPVLTYVMEFNDAIVKDAIERELARNGQVYFVHNRIHDIFEVARKIQKLVPDARILVAHGRMTGSELEDIMLDFLEYNYDILVTTTIIESGLDIKNANTLIIDNGDYMGLSQLYQLRGRVGRSNVQGYTYVTHRPKVLSELSQKRLKAIKDFTAFGSGFKIALRDLEIRGAGNILGSAQSGNLATIGYELYCRILDEAVNERLGKKTAFATSELIINLNVSSYIPERYISDEELKYDIYKKLSYVKSQDDYNDLEDELLDRFGEIPDGVYNLMALAMIKHLGRSLGMTEIRERGSSVLFTFDNKREIPIPAPELMKRLFDEYKIKFNAGKGDQIRWRIVLKHEKDQTYLNELGKILAALVSEKN
ncbi:transcription-repair coupling factor [Acetobacterium fimetarium]|uniref:Transcription-repair-coupling factor n=1 Tax=Acetobacterium fimetarium TaxID=52691 RepID=A0ABR6WTQ3_9FIRM|nr:transcription-repair coupling factor [Acetobacterium fimetarium]MBC3803596.1 transcription-repair coupling factor [Acetobacterium fimetarium]